jgi:hypothetical protein
MIQTFKEWYSTQLNEMPYLYVNSNNTEKQFDPEVEIRSLPELEALLIDLLLGKPQTDKYNNTIQLNTPEEKQQLINTLKDPKDRFMLMILGKYGSQISPNVQNIKKPNEKRQPEEVTGYVAWVDKLIKKSNLSL